MESKCKKITKKIFSTRIDIKKEKIKENLIIFISAILLITILNLINASLYYENLLEAALSTIILLPIFGIILFSIIFIFMASYSKKEIGFWKTFLISTNTIFTFFIVGSIFKIIYSIFENQTITNFLLLIQAIFLIIVLYIYIIRIKKNLKINNYQTISSIINTVILIILITIFLAYQYMLSLA